MARSAWFAWLAPAGYMLDQTEEYGIDMFGHPKTCCIDEGKEKYRKEMREKKKPARSSPCGLDCSSKTFTGGGAI
jgi:hypothetical protein